MQLLVQPNKWSCLPTSLAMVIDEPFDKVIDTIGHDGSGILYPEYGVDPLQRRAFHILEITYAAWQLDWSLVGFENIYFEPLGKDVGGKEYTIDEIIEPLLKSHNAILIGELRGNSHAVAWNAARGVVHDPTSGTRYERNLFDIHSVHVAVPIGVKTRTEIRKTEQ